MPKSKTCIICGKSHTNTLSKCCSQKCQNKWELQRRKERVEKAQERINVSISWIDETHREEAKKDIRKCIAPYLKNKKLTIKVGRGKVKTDFQKLKDKLDAVFSKYIRKRDNYKCVVCWSTESPQNWHLLSRVNLSTRWDEINCNCQCAKCNILHENDSKPYTDWFIENYWQSMYEDLRDRWHGKPFKITSSWLSEKIEYYSDK